MIFHLTLDTDRPGAGAVHLDDLLDAVLRDTPSGVVPLDPADPDLGHFFLAPPTPEPEPGTVAARLQALLAVVRSEATGDATRSDVARSLATLALAEHRTALEHTIHGWAGEHHGDGPAQATMHAGTQQLQVTLRRGGRASTVEIHAPGDPDPIGVGTLDELTGAVWITIR